MRTESLYMTLAHYSSPQATNTHLNSSPAIDYLGRALLTSKGASGVRELPLSDLVANMMVIPTIPVAANGVISHRPFPSACARCASI